MKYDFTTIIDRHGKDAMAIDNLENLLQGAPPLREGFDFIPMWVADMNFQTVPTVPQAIIHRAQHGLYGYFRPPQEYFDAIIQWHTQRNQVQGLEKEHIGYENGVLGGVISAVSAFAAPGDPVLLHAPTYLGFTKSLTANGFRLVHSDLKKDDAGIWRMDFEDMEAKLRDNQIHVAVFCSPHNPCGRVWERWELEKAMALYKKYDVVVISDEIWSDIVMPGYQHIPLQSVSQDARNRVIAFYAPSKTFNLAGLVGSYHIIYNQYLRDRVESKGHKPHYNEMNVLSMHALMGAYQPEGYEWCNELVQVIDGNLRYACDFIRSHFPGVEVMQPQGTYMLFADCAAWCQAHGKTCLEVLHRGYEFGIGWQGGFQFNAPTSIRINLALPRAKVEEAFQRMKQYVFNDQW